MTVSRCYKDHVLLVTSPCHDQAVHDRGLPSPASLHSPFVNAKAFMNEVTPWISDYFTNLATIYGSDYLSAPPVEKLRKCQLKKVHLAISVRLAH